MSAINTAADVATKRELKRQFKRRLYRQEKSFERLGANLSRQTMANWVLNGTERWLNPIYQRLREHLLKRDILLSDDTPLQVLREPGRAAETQSYMWLYRTGRQEPFIVLRISKPRGLRNTLLGPLKDLKVTFKQNTGCEDIRMLGTCQT